MTHRNRTSSGNRGFWPRVTTVALALVFVFGVTGVPTLAGQDYPLAIQSSVYAISSGIDLNAKHQLWKMNPLGWLYEQESFLSLPRDGNVYYSIGGLTSAYGALYAISSGIDLNGKHQLWVINPANGTLSQQFFVSLPSDGNVYYNVGGLAFANGYLWAISSGIDLTGKHQLWQINPANGAFVRQFFVSVPSDGNVYYNIGGLAFGNDYLWAISSGVDLNGKHQLSEINPANGTYVRDFFVSLPRDGNVYYSVGGLTFGNGNLYSISSGIDLNGKHQLSQIDPSNGAYVQQFFVSLPSDGGFYYNVAGLAWQ